MRLNPKQGLLALFSSRSLHAQTQRLQVGVSGKCNLLNYGQSRVKFPFKINESITETRCHSLKTNTSLRTRLRESEKMLILNTFPFIVPSQADHTMCS